MSLGRPVDGLLRVELKIAVHVHAKIKLHGSNLTPGLLTPHSEAEKAEASNGEVFIFLRRDNPLLSSGCPCSNLCDRIKDPREKYQLCLGTIKRRNT